jgi:3-isopropylmalate/(R)-2-methylmalate dehydratase small subunit
VDLENCTVGTPQGESWSFAIPDADREMLLEGLDSIAVTLKRDAAILAYRDRDRVRRPWIYLPARDK